MSVEGHGRMREVAVQAIDAARLEPLIGAARMEQYLAEAERARELFAGRAVVSVNSTAAGGGVAELLQSLLAYARGAGVDARWLVIDGDPAFFAITKRIHNWIYGTPGDGGPLGETERAHYEAVAARNAQELRALVRPGDVVLLHDPQPAGLAPALRALGVPVVWRCHIGCDVANEWTERAWAFLRRYVEPVDGIVVSHAGFAPPWADPARVHVIPPSIDPFSAKNQPLEPAQVRDALVYVGVLAGEADGPHVGFTRRDGSPGRINRHADVLQTGPPPPPDAPLVAQVSRWDRLKDMPGVMEAFAHHVDPSLGAHLLLAGPVVTGVADDPEGGAVLRDCIDRWRRLPHHARSRVHLACMPMADPDEQAAIVNALQRHASVVVQKSLAEGFGLTVSEAMWKERPVVGSAVGGIVDQIRDGEDGLLLPDPHDLAACGAAIERLLRDPLEAARLARNGHVRVRDEFLGDRHLERYASLFAQVVAARTGGGDAATAPR
ncbi:MAG: glycosyltransferase [Actinobacteria bacterium]|nr:glycosyltransferase [Actinomycetota bacterium]